MTVTVDRDDIELPSPWEKETDCPDDLTVRKLVESCRKKALEQSMKYMATAEYNERMVVGDQFIKITDGSEIESLGDSDWPSFVPKSSRNLLRNLQLTWSSRLLEDRPWVAAYPSEPGVDEMKAHAAQQVLEYARQTHDFDDQCFRAANLVQPHSCVGWKIVWDPLRGPPSKGVPRIVDGMPQYDMDGHQVLDNVGEPQGDVSWDIVSIFDYATDGAEEAENAKWCYFTKIVDPYDAMHLLEMAGKEPKPDKKTYTDIWGVEREGVEVTELWWRPDYRFPQGLFCVCVGGMPIQAIPFPYEHGELPIAVWKCGSRRNSPYGSTHVDDAVPIQRVINETVAALQQQARQIGSVKLICSTQIAAAIQHGNQIIPCDDPQTAQAARWLEPPPRSAVLVDTLEDNVNALYNVYGLNEVLSGAANVKSGTSAKSIAYINKLDSMKQAGASRSLNKAILRICRQTLKLYQQYVQEPRLAQIIGEQNDMSSREFVGADLMGVDVKLESASAVTQMRGQVAGDAQAAMAAGNMDPTLAQTARTGIQDTSLARASRDIVRAQAEAALRGEQEPADTEVDPQTAIAELQTIMASVRGHPNAMYLQTLLQGYQQRLGQMMPDGGGQPAAAEPAKAPPGMANPEPMPTGCLQ